MECSASDSFDLMLLSGAETAQKGTKECQECKKEVQDISRFLCQTRRSAKINTTTTTSPPEIVRICTDKMCWEEEVPRTVSEKVTRQEAESYLFCDNNQVENPLDIVLSIVAEAIDSYLVTKCKETLPKCICITRPILKLVNLFIFLMPISFFFVKTDANPVPININGKYAIQLLHIYMI